jgi:hypothetical protein
MADYHPLIARAVEGLENSTGEARRGLYERARAALVSQLRSIDPPLSEADITRERLALEDAIRKVEAESVRKARAERPAPVPPPRPAAPPKPPAPPAAPVAPQRERPSPQLGDMPTASPRPGLGSGLGSGIGPGLGAGLGTGLGAGLGSGRAAPARPEPLRMDSDVVADEAPPAAAAPGSARARLMNARTSPVPRERFKGFRDVVNEVDDLGAASARSAQSARDTRDSYGTAPARQFADDEEEFGSPHDRLERHFDRGEPDVLDDETLHPFEPDEDVADREAPPPNFTRPQPRMREPEDHYTEPRPPRSYRGLAKLAVVVIILLGITATISWQWSNITGLYNFISHMRSKPTQTAQAPAAEPKFSGRVPQEQMPGQQQAPAPAPAPGGATGEQAAPQVAQRVVLYEEDPNNPAGRQYVGSAVWRTETVSPGSGLAPELEVRADITIPERNMTVTWTLRRNTDQALPASHTIEIMFNLPPDFAGGGIANVPGVLMKDSEQARGVPLAGLAVKVTNGFFLIGLSAVDADVQRNIDLLKTRPWFDIPIVYNNGGRAILALEKGPPGDRAFADAFAAWAK